MADRRIYAGYYRRYDGKLIYVVTAARDTDTDEEMVIWTPATYSEKHAYCTTSKQSFCESVLVDGMRQPKFKRQTQMRVLDSVVESFEAEGFIRPARKEALHPDEAYENWHRPCAASYKHTVELDMMMGILADSYELTEGDMRRRRAESVRNVKNTNGRMPFEQKVRAANEAEDEWPD